MRNKRLTCFFACLWRVLLLALPARAAEFEIVDVLRVDGYTIMQSSVDVAGNRFAVGGSTLSAQYGKVGIGTSTPSFLLQISSAPGAGGDLLVISTGSSDVIRMTGAGEIYANKFYGDGFGLTNLAVAGDDLGNHVATATLNMAGFNIVSAASVTASSLTVTGNAFSVGGATLNVNAGNVGIGTVPGVRLHVSGPGSDILRWQYGADDTYGLLTAGTAGVGLDVYNADAGYGLGVSFGGVEAHRFTKEGNVGIGMVNPGVRLEVSGQAKVAGTDNNVVRWQYGADDTYGMLTAGIGGVGLDVVNANAGFGLAMMFDGVETHRFTKAGNVGIGTVDPGARLEVAGQVKITGGTPGPGKVLISDAVGLASWATPTGDNLGDHTATTQLKMGNYAVWSSSDITAARYQINGSTMVAVLPGMNSIAYGLNAGRSNVVSGDYNTFIGNDAGASNTTADNNTANGYAALYSNTTGNGNTANGGSALYFNTTGFQNTANGYYALYSNTAGSRNTANGSFALRFNTTGSRNIANGDTSLASNTTGDDNIVIGYAAGSWSTTGSANTLIGSEAGKGASGNSFSSSTIAGYQAGISLTTGSDNLLLGWRTGDALTTGSRNIIIGYDTDASAPAASSELNLGGVLFGKLDARTVGISTRVPQAALDIVSTGTAANIYAQFWRNGSGVVVASMTSEGALQPRSLEVNGAALFSAEYNNGNSGTAATITWANGSKQVLTLTGNATLTFSAPAGKAGSFVLRLVQDATGSRTVTWPAAVKWRGAVAGNLSTAASSVDIVTFYYDGTNYYACASTGYQ